MPDTAPAPDDLSSKLTSAIAAPLPGGGGGPSKPPVNSARLREALGVDKINANLATEDENLSALKQDMSFPKLTQPPPQQPQSDPFQAFGQPAMYLAIFGSLLTRNPLASAVNAGASVLKNTQAKDSAIGQQQYEEWKINSENAVKLAQYEMNAYKTLMADKNSTIREKEAAWKVAAAVYKNPNLQTILDSEGVHGAEGYAKAYEKHVGDVADTFTAAHDHITSHAQGGSSGGGGGSGGTGAPASTHAAAGALNGDARRQLVAQALDADDPKVNAQGVDLLARQLEDTMAGKVPASERAKMELTLTKLAKISADLRSGDPAKVDAARKEAGEIPEIGPGLLSSARPQKATAGSVAAERDARFAEIKAEDPSLSTAAIWDKVNQDVLISKSAQFPPGTAEMLADRAIAGDFSGLTGFGRSPALLKQLDTALNKRMQEHDPPLTGADLARIKVNYAAYAQGAKAFEAGGKLEPTVRSLNVVTQHLDTLAEAAKALSQNDMPALNALQNTLGREFGMTGPVTFDAIKGVVAAEIEKAVTGSAGAVTDREDLKANLNKSLSAAQLADVISGYEHLMAGQINGLGQSYDRVQKLGGAPGGDFGEKFLSPQTRAIVAGGGRGLPAPKLEAATISSAEELKSLPHGSWYRLPNDPVGKARFNP